MGKKQKKIKKKLKSLNKNRKDGYVFYHEDGKFKKKKKQNIETENNKDEKTKK